MKAPTGTYHYGVTNEMAQAIGDMIVQWSHLEEAMIEVLASLLGGANDAPARQIFRSLTSVQARLKVMNSLLHEAKSNKGKPKYYGEIISEFASLNKLRNQYVHGLWYTHATGAPFISKPTSDDEMPFLARKPISVKQVQHTVKRMMTLLGDLTAMRLD